MTRTKYGLMFFALLPVFLSGNVFAHQNKMVTNAPEHLEPVRYPILTLGDSAPAVLYLHELLARLGYLPVDFHPVAPIERLSGETLDSPSAGIWTWRYDNTPKEVQDVWKPTVYTEVTRGAVMTFQMEHGLPIDGFAGPKVFQMLKLALVTNIRCEHPYTHVLVQQSVPQTLTVWQEGKVVLRSLCSTGVAEAATHAGTHTIYLRNIKQSMDGETPWGGYYHVENVPYVSFFYKGEAIHGLKRSVYGMPQSVGCVELPIDQAKLVWNLTDYGTLVTVTK